MPKRFRTLPTWRATVAGSDVLSGNPRPLPDNRPGRRAVRTRARPPLAFLLVPFTDYIRHAFREK